jgi:hypothetical protein
MSDLKKIHAHMHIGGGSHLPILMKIMSMTDGPVLELGMGLFSTPFLHWACYDAKRKLTSYENKQHFYELFDFYDRREDVNDYSYHEINLVENWDDVVFSGQYSIALIDHNPGPRRKDEIRRLANSVDYMIVHDANGRHDKYYKFTEIYPLFKYRKDITVYPQTTILSNFKDLSEL